MAVYLDDGWGTEKDSQVCSIVADAVRTDLSKAGFVTNEDKSVWIPCQRLDQLSIALVEPLKLSMGGLQKKLVPLTILSTPILFFLPEDWPLLQGR